ncbi:hypothetical protein BH09ACT7_BH09ACT7_20350 [soil metagenome]
MPLPTEDVAVIREWAGALNAGMPPQVAAELRYEIETDRNAVTVFECRQMDTSESWFKVPLARLRFFRSRGWELYYADRDSNFHVYEQVEPTQYVAELLDEIDDDPTCIFFG